MRTAVVAVAAFLAASTSASANPGNCALEPPPAPSPRIVHTALDGLDLNVLLPSDYATSGRRYPVLYLLHGADYDENTWLDETDLAAYTAPFTGDRAAIVVMPDGGPMSLYTDWYQGDEQWETYHVDHVVPWVDAHFRTVADRAHRVVAGFSVGGLGAAEYAARHPDVFSVLGSFSGLDHLTIPESPYAGAASSHPHHDAGAPGPAFAGRPTRAYRPPDDQGSGCGPSNGSAFGDPVRDRVVWHDHNPTDLASNLRGVAVYVAAGNGVPCDAAEVTGQPSFAFGIEPGIRQMTQAFDAALTRAGVPHTTALTPCGLHSQAAAQRDLHAFWPLMLRSIGHAPPRRFDYRTADPDFSLYGFDFRADPRRALEFLEVRDASASGFMLTGSGTETVVTPGRWRRRQRVRVSGARPAVAVADAHGRLTLRVDLGAPHTTEQFAPGAGTPTFSTRVIRLRAMR
jgi:S-formylglutathione hydrolase FrmB